MCGSNYDVRGGGLILLGGNEQCFGISESCIEESSGFMDNCTKIKG